MGAHALSDEIAALLAAGEHSADGITLERCATGGNNRVFLVVTRDRRLIAKWYFTHQADNRDRLRAEYAFLSYAQALGLSCIPHPICSDPEARLALFEFVDGRKLAAAEVGEEEVNAALEFFLALNLPAHRELAKGLTNASEACFSLTDHFDMVDARLARLDGITPESNVDCEAQNLATKMRSKWSQLKELMKHNALSLGLDPSAELPLADRCISPSDFGFHNALMTPDGTLVFIDFEYSGWDDPAKFANDFFCQPAVPMNVSLYDAFLDRAMKFSANAAALANRARLMRPIFQMKWCCIILNDFLPIAAQRRRFADPMIDIGHRKLAQLELAHNRFSAIQP
jgi:hypothetical protein